MEEARIKYHMNLMDLYTDIPYPTRHADKDKAVRLLVEKYGANRQAKNIHGQVAFDLVSDANDPRWVGLLTGVVEV